MADKNGRQIHAGWKLISSDQTPKPRTLKPIESTNREATEVTVRGAKRERPEISGWRKAA